MSNLLQIEIDGKSLAVKSGMTVMEAAQDAGTYIPHFCYHRKLSIAANCRMCLVEVEKAPKPLPACATPVTEGMKVKTHSDLAVQAQKGVMEFLLINHPLDCPICDQGGECQLQDLAVGYGGIDSRYTEDKRVVKNKNMGSLISTDMTRCIHCTRCVRFTEEIAGYQEIGIVGRGMHSEIMPYLEQTVNSELSGNVIDLCPVGALTSKPFRYSARTWELSRRKSLSPHDGLGSRLVVQVKNQRVMRVLPLEGDDVNECWLSDRDRFSYEGLNSPQRLTQPMLKQDGKWRTVDWKVALEYVAHGLRDIKRNDGLDHIAALASANSSVEELYLLNQLAQKFGFKHVDTRLRQSDFRADVVQNKAFGLPFSIEEFATQRAFVLVGCDLRKEQPLLAQRLRQAVKKWASVSSIDLFAHDLLIPQTVQQSVAPSGLLPAFAAVYLALLAAKNKSVAPHLQAVAQVASVTEEAKQIATDLSADKSLLILGEQAINHPDFAALLQLAQAIGQLSGAKLAILSAGANSIGAWVAGAHPKHTGAEATAGILSSHKRAFLLLGIEPDRDFYDSTLATQALQQAKMVVALSAFKTDSLSSVADVLLPISPFSETSGTYINLAGIVQHTNAVVKPLGETRPAWKVLRVLANILKLDGFEFESAEMVAQAALADYSAPSEPQYFVAPQSVTHQVWDGTLLQRIGDVSLYHSDMLVRHAPALQLTQDAEYAANVFVSAVFAAHEALVEGDAVICTQGEISVTLPVKIDSCLAANAVRLAAGTAQSAQLGGLFDMISLKKA